MLLTPERCKSQFILKNVPFSSRIPLKTQSLGTWSVWGLPCVEWMGWKQERVAESWEARCRQAEASLRPPSCGSLSVSVETWNLLGQEWKSWQPAGPQLPRWVTGERHLTSVCLPLQWLMLSLSVGMLSALQGAPLNICRLTAGKKYGKLRVKNDELWNVLVAV